MRGIEVWSGMFKMIDDWHSTIDETFWQIGNTKNYYAQGVAI
jgi:hypothetical protein